MSGVHASSSGSDVQKPGVDEWQVCLRSNMDTMLTNEATVWPVSDADEISEQIVINKYVVIQWIKNNFDDLVKEFDVQVLEGEDSDSDIPDL